MDYRERLYKYYVTRHTSLIYDISMNMLNKQAAVYRKYYGSFLPKDRTVKILELGAGYGGFLYFLNKNGYKNTMGVDCSQEQVDMAVRLGVGNVFHGDILETLNKYNQEFDVIVALEVVEHFNKEELSALFNALSLALKPGGMFIMKSPNADGPFSGRYRYWDITHEIAFTATSIRQLLKVFGFERIEVYPTGPLIHGIPSLLRYFIWQFFRYIMILYLAAETGSFKGHILTQNLIAVARLT